MRKVIAEKPRCDDHPRAQRLIPRLKMATVVKAVAKTFDMDEKDLRHRHGRAPRMLAAWIGWNEGLLRLRAIAAALSSRRLRSQRGRAISSSGAKSSGTRELEQPGD